MNKIDMLTQLTNESPKNPSLWYLLGEAYEVEGNNKEAIRALSESLRYCDDELKEKILVKLMELTNNGENPTNNIHQQQGIEDNKESKLSSETDSNRSDLIEDNTHKDNEKVVKLKVINGGGSQKNTLLDDGLPQITFQDVGGLDHVKESIHMKIVKPFSNPGLFARFKKKTGGGLILYGPPGCGKTFVARAAAGECRAKFIPVHITDILDPYMGVSEQNLKGIFSTARANKPSVLFIDEMDATGFHRGKSSSSVLRPVVDQLLAEIEGIDTSTDKMLIIGATNMPWDIDPAFLRPGRFDKAIFVSPPDQRAREIIFQLKLEGRPVDQLDISALAKSTELYSGADIENVVETATEIVISEIMRTGVERGINMKDMMEAIGSTNPSTLEWLKTIKNYIKYANQSGFYNDVEKYIKQYKSL